LGYSVTGAHQVTRKGQDDDRLAPLVVDYCGQLVLEERHQHVVLVVDGVVRIVGVDATRHDRLVEEVALLCGTKESIERSGVRQVSIGLICGQHNV